MTYAMFFTVISMLWLIFFKVCTTTTEKAYALALAFTFAGLALAAIIKDAGAPL